VYAMYFFLFVVKEQSDRKCKTANGTAHFRQQNSLIARSVSVGSQSHDKFATLYCTGVHLPRT
jgi:hypothetical protein